MFRPEPPHIVAIREKVKRGETLTLDEKIDAYQWELCRPCGLKCPRKSVAMTLCVEARIAEKERRKSEGVTPPTSTRYAAEV